MNLKQSLEPLAALYDRGLQNGWFYLALFVTVALNTAIVYLDAIPVIPTIVRFLAVTGAIALYIDSNNIEGYGVSKGLALLILAPTVTIFVGFLPLAPFVVASILGLLIYTVTSSFRSKQSFFEFNKPRQAISTLTIAVGGVFLISMLVFGTGGGGTTPVESPQSTATPTETVSDVSVDVTFASQSGTTTAQVEITEIGSYGNTFGYKVIDNSGDGDGTENIQWAESNQRFSVEGLEQGDTLELYYKHEDGEANQFKSTTVVGNAYTTSFVIKHDDETVGYAMIVETVEGTTITTTDNSGDGDSSTTKANENGVGVVANLESSDTVSVTSNGRTLYENPIGEAHAEHTRPSSYQIELQTSENELSIWVGMNGLYDCSDFSASINGNSVSKLSDDCSWTTSEFSSGDTVQVYYQGQLIATYTV